MTYSWAADEPVDVTFAASSIHTQIKADKVAIRERFEAPNAAFNEHGDSDDAAVGVHIASKVGWARASTLANRLSTGLKVGSLHWVTDESLMYVVDNDPKFVVIHITDHALLDGLTDDDHVMYVLKDGARAMTDNITLDGGTLQSEAYPEADSVALDPAHASESWYAAHGADSIRDRHIEDGAVAATALATNFFFQYPRMYATLKSHLGMILSSTAHLDGSTSGAFALMWNTDGTFGARSTGSSSVYAMWASREMVSP